MRFMENMPLPMCIEKEHTYSDILQITEYGEIIESETGLVRKDLTKPNQELAIMRIVEKEPHVRLLGFDKELVDSWGFKEWQGLIVPYSEMTGDSREIVYPETDFESSILKISSISQVITKGEVDDRNIHTIINLKESSKKYMIGYIKNWKTTWVIDYLSNFGCEEIRYEEV